MGVRARRVDNVEVPQKRIGAKHLDDVFGEIEFVSFFAIFKKAMRSVVGTTSDLQKSSPKSELSKRGLARVDLADDDKEERVLQIRHEIVEQGEAAPDQCHCPAP